MWLVVKAVPARNLAFGKLSCLLAATALAAVAGCGSASCLSIAKAYADEVPNALMCDPGAANACAAQRPTVVYEQSGQKLTLEGLGTCAHAMNPARTARLDQILAQYNSEGCQLLATPVCPAPSNLCVSTSTGSYSCFP
jgi:hypothetical protein